MAGLGKQGRNGLLISKTYGVSQRIAVVFTDVEGLELHEDEEYEWVFDFCQSCGKCIEACPVEALHEEFVPDEFGQLTSTDGDRCLPYFGENWGCSICVGVCPFTRSSYDHIKQSWERRRLRASA
jgi:epoxyqueuosine reductase QueG